MKIEITGKGTINQTVIVKDIEGDMGEKSHIQLIMQPDGDVILCFYNPEKNFIDSIEFCSSNGGGKNPVIAKKLRELINELTFKAGK